MNPPEHFPGLALLEKGKPPVLLSLLMDGDWVDGAVALAESTAYPASTWPESPMGESPPQALPQGGFLLSPPTSVVLYTQSYLSRAGVSGPVRPGPCPPEELTTDSLRSAYSAWEPRGEGLARPPWRCGAWS